MQLPAAMTPGCVFPVGGPAAAAAEYTLLSPIGKGAMGAIFDAVQNSLKRRVALKLLDRGLMVDPLARERFLREARAASQLVHPHIVRIFDAGVIRGCLFLAMQRVHGVDLQQTIDLEGGLPLARVLRLMIQAADALAHVHAAGMCHRDVKPANLMLSNDDTITLIDFGMVKMPMMVTITRTGMAVGTPFYLAPEAIEPCEPTPPQDIYGLALTLHALVSGRPPYAVRNLTELLALKWAGKAPRLTDACPEAPPFLVSLQESALALDPAVRPTAAAYRDALAACLTSLLRSRVTRSRAAPPGPVTRRARAAAFPSAARRRGHALRAVCGAVLVAAAVLGIVSARQREAIPVRPDGNGARSAPDRARPRLVMVHELTCVPMDREVLVDLELDVPAVVTVEVFQSGQSAPLATRRGVRALTTFRHVFAGLVPGTPYALSVRFEGARGGLTGHRFVTRSDQHARSVAGLLSGRSWAGKLELGTEFFRANPDLRAIPFFRRALADATIDVISLPKLAELTGRLRSQELAELLVRFLPEVRDRSVRYRVLAALVRARHVAAPTAAQR